MRILYLQPNSDTKFFSQILDLYSDFVKGIAEKIDSHPQIVPNILKSFLKTKLGLYISME